MKTNIIIVGLCEKIVRNVARNLANNFDLFYADVVDIMEYNLMDEKKMKKVCGIKYLKNAKQKVVKEICQYENSIINVPVPIFINEDFLPKFKSSASGIVFLNFSKRMEEKYYLEIENTQKEEIKNETVSHDIRSKICKENCDINVKLSTLNEKIILRKVEKAIDKYLS